MKSFKDIKFKELILNNWPLKILAIVIAVVLWIIIINVDNPSQRKTITGIGVELINAGELTQKGYIYQVEAGSIISVVVKAPQSVVDELRASDFYAYADLSERSPDSDRAKIYVKCTKEEIIGQIDIVGQTQDYVQLSIDNRMDMEFEVEAEITGNPSKGYVVGETTVSPTTIKVSGAEAVVSKIDKAKVVYNVDDMTASIEDDVKPVFFDKNGKEISSEKLELNRDKVKLIIDILPTKTIPVNYEVNGELDEGYEITDITANITEVTIAGTKDELAKKTSIDIPGDKIDITGIKEDTTFEIPLNTLISTGYTITSAQSVLRVEVKVEKVADSVIIISSDDIEVRDVPKELTYNLTIVSQVLTVGVRGTEANLSTLTAKELAPYISLEGKKQGTYTIKVNFAESDNYKITGTYYVKIEISDEKESESQEEETPASEEAATDANETERTAE